LLDWKAKKFAFMSKTPAFAVYGDIFAGETRGGEIGIYRVSDKTYQSGLDLPNSPLGTTTAAAFSLDGKWLAVSGRTRGAVWNIDTGERTFLTRGFDGAFFDKDQLFAKFPKQGTEAAAVFKMDTASKSLQNAYNLWDENKPGQWQLPRPIRQLGELLVKTSWESDKKIGDVLLLEAFDVRTNTKLWQRQLERKMPGLFYSRIGQSLTLVVANYGDMKEEAKKYEDLHARLEELGSETRRQASYIVEVLDFSTGKDRGRVLVDSGNLSFKVLAASAVGDTLLVSDSVNRTLVYSLSAGVQKGKVFGYARAVSADGHRIFVENGKGNVDLYDVATLQSLAHFSFPSQIAHAEFSTDGSSVLVLTADQTIYRVQLPPPSAAALH
jgi:WD40 repeat protein